MLSLSEIKSTFKTRDWQNGQRLADFGYVDKKTIQHDEFGFSGTVKSESSRQHYYISVEADELGVDIGCTCPVGYFCKHAAALVIIVLGADKIRGELPNRVVENWLNEIQPTKKSDNSHTSRLIYILDNNGYGHSGLSIDVKRSRVLKSGELSKSLQNVYLSDYFLRDQNLTETERHICADIMSIKNISRDNQQDLSLIKRLVATERCFWQKMANGPITVGDECQAHFVWQGKELFKLKAELINKSGELLSTAPLSYIDTKHNTLGEVDFGMQAERVQHLLTLPALTKQQASWVLPQLKVFLAEDFTHVGTPIGTSEIKLFTPTPKLHLSSPAYNAENSRAVLVFDYGGINIHPQDASQVVTSKGKVLGRNLAFEQQAIAQLHDEGFQTLKNYYMDYGGSHNAYTLSTNKNRWPYVLHQLIPKLQSQGWHITEADEFYYSTVEAGNFEAEIDEQGNDFFSLEMHVDIDGKRQSLFPILQSAISQLPKQALIGSEVVDDTNIYVDMGKGQFLSLALSKVKPLLDQFVELFMPNALNKEGALDISRLQSHSTLEALDTQNITSSGAKELRKVAKQLNDFDGIKPVECPNTVNATLRDYQKEGLNWLQFLREYQLAGILADDMGLGKTLQALANLSVEQQQGRLTSPALIIAPTSVIFNWQAEIEKFNPSLKSIIIHGDKRKPLFEEIQRYQVVITSYPLVLRDIEHYQNQLFHYLILDEAHYIKNPKTKLYGAILTLNATHKLCITGTPMENHLGELWAQFNFLLPSFLASQGQFTKLFRTPIEKQHSAERKSLLTKRIQPFILRRTKDKIAKELPVKTEIIRHIRLEPKQAELYESVRLVMDSRLREIIKSKGLLRSQIEILDAMLKLRQVCCHPQLLSLPSAKKVTQSAKLDYLMEMLPELVEEGRRILLFSQFTSMLALIEVELTKNNIEYVKLTGSTKDRQKVINAFKQGEMPVFLISLKAGGTGLNLTEADTVIHYDPWWNPAVENQATDRVHRIGQNKPVFVYKLIVEGSIEQKIHELQQNKSELADSILSNKLSDKESRLTSDTLQSLLRPLNE